MSCVKERGALGAILPRIKQWQWWNLQRRNAISTRMSTSVYGSVKLTPAHVPLVQSGGKPVFHLEMTRWNKAEISLQIIQLQYNSVAAHLLSALHSHNIFSSSTATRLLWIIFYHEAPADGTWRLGEILCCFSKYRSKCLWSQLIVSLSSWNRLIIIDSTKSRLFTP